jgi:hypothetical protein
MRAMRSRKRNSARACLEPEWTRMHRYLQWDDDAERAVVQGSAPFDFRYPLVRRMAFDPQTALTSRLSAPNRAFWLVWDKGAPLLLPLFGCFHAGRWWAGARHDRRREAGFALVSRWPCLRAPRLISANSLRNSVYLISSYRHLRNGPRRIPRRQAIGP